MLDLLVQVQFLSSPGPCASFVLERGEVSHFSMIRFDSFRQGQNEVIILRHFYSVETPHQRLSIIKLQWALLCIGKNSEPTGSSEPL